MKKKLPTESGHYWMRENKSKAWKTVTVSVLRTQITYYKNGNGIVFNANSETEFAGPITPPKS